MFIILGADGKEYGPVPAEKITEWIAGGRANFQTKARRDGEAEWKTLGDFPEFTAGAVPPPPVPPPTAGQAAAVRATLQGTPAEIAAQLTARSPGLSLGQVFSDAFKLWMENLLPLVGVTALSMILQMIVSVIPLVSIVNTFFLSGIFTGGLYYYYLGRLRGEPREVGDIFAGFSKALVPLGLTNLLMMALMIAVMLPFMAPLIGGIVKIAAADGDPLQAFAGLGGALIGLSCLGIIPLLYLAIAWVLAYALVIDQGLGPWTALEVSRRLVTRRWFSVFALMFCASIIAALGVIGLIVGIFFTIPIAVCMTVCIYEALAGGRSATANPASPRLSI
jgi:hypothetical protein